MSDETAGVAGKIQLAIENLEALNTGLSTPGVPIAVCEAAFDAAMTALKSARAICANHRVSIAAIEATRNALRADAAGNAKCTMTDLDSACDMLDALIAMRSCEAWP